MNAPLFHVMLVAFSVASFVTPAALAGGPGQWTIVDTFSVPEGASGLAWDGTWLYCGIYGPDGGRIYRIDPADGTSTLLFTGPQEDAFGLTYDGTNLWTTDHPGSVSSPAIAMKLDWDGSLLEQFDLPEHYHSGIAYDAGEFWTSRYYPDPGHLYRMDGTGAVLGDFACPDDQPWDICFQDDDIWVADYWGDTLYKIKSSDGSLIESHASEGTDPAGVVWDGTHLWYCDNGEGGVDFLYKVDLSGAGTPSIGIPVADHDYGPVAIGDMVTWNVTVQNNGSAPLDITGIDFGGNRDLTCPVAFPLTIPIGMSDVLPIQFAPSAFYELVAVANVSSTDPIHPEEAVALAGYGVFPAPTIDVAETAHDYGSVRQNATTRWFVDISNHGEQLLTIDDIAIDDARFYLDESVTLPIALSTLATTQVGVWFSPDTTSPIAGSMTVSSNDASFAPVVVSLSGSGDDTPHPIGDELWSFEITTGFDQSPKAMTPIPDISGDGVADLIVCSEDDYVRCFNGNAHAFGDVLWANDFGLGRVYDQKGVQIIPDIDEDGFADVVVGTSGGQRVVRALSGKTGVEIWTYDTAEYGDGGWVYQVSADYDYNDDGSVDILAATGDDGDDMGPKRVFCINGLTGTVIWNRPIGGPVFGVIGIEDVNGDDQPDVLAGASNAIEDQGAAYGIDGATGSILWPFAVAGTSVWGLAQLEDINGDGIKDVLVADFFGTVHGLSGRTGAELYSSGGFGIITRVETLGDLTGDGHPEVFPTHSGNFARVLSGIDGVPTWTTPISDNASTAARIDDVSGDGVDDVVVGTLFTANATYFLDGVGGAVLHTASYPEPVDAITAIPDITGDGSWELVAGGRFGEMRCLSGGLAVIPDDCPGDTNGDGDVDVNDLNAVILDWGTDGSANGGDVTGGLPGSPPDGIVNVNDLNAVIVNWGMCP